MRSLSTSAIISGTGLLPYPLAYYRTISNMNPSATGYGGPSLGGGDPRQFGISHTRADNSMTNNVHGNSNTNCANVSSSYNNNTINMGTNEESLRIQEWLSPLEPGRRHRGVRNRRLDGIGDWVLQTDEFVSWCRSRGALDDRALRCYGGQGVGKTYIRYENAFREPSTMLTRKHQFISNRHPVRAGAWPEYRRFISLLRLPGAEGPIGGKHDRGPTQAG